MISQQHNLILNDFVAVKRAKPETASHLRRQSHLQVVVGMRDENMDGYGLWISIRIVAVYTRLFTCRNAETPKTKPENKDREMDMRRLKDAIGKCYTSGVAF